MNQKFRDRILEVLNDNNNFGINEPLTLFDKLHVSKLITMVMFIGENTGRVYFFSLNKIIPESWSKYE